MHERAPAAGVRERDGGRMDLLRRAQDRAVLADPLQGAEDRGVEPAVRHPARTVDGRQCPPGAPRHLHDPTGTCEAVEHRQLGVVAEPGECDVHGVELRPDLGPGGVGRCVVGGAFGG